MTYRDLPRIAWLASDANPDRKSREAYARLATQPYVSPAPSNTEQGGQAIEVEDRPTAAESLALLKVARECPHRSVPSCSCVFAHCKRDGKDKSAAQCIDCLRSPPASSSGGEADGGITGMGTTILESAV